MTTNAPPPSGPARERPSGGLLAGAGLTPPLTTDERLQQIAALGRRIHGYVEFMGQVGSLNGTSGEAKDRAVAAFLERLAALERQLGRIQEALRLG